MGESTTSMQSLVVAMSSSLLRDTHILPRAARSFSRVSASAAAPRLVWTGWPKPASPRGLAGYTRGTMMPDYDTCYRAIQSRDTRFDGWFFVAVSSTRIYCRPSCPAAMPKPEHMSFLPTAAAAQAAGYRACLRCRPDATPGSPEWNLRADVAGRALRLIADGVVDREGVDGLARRLAYSPRQLRRLLQSELGAGPLGLARAQRAHTARLLIETTGLPFAEVAFAAGFASLRQFNDTVREVFALTPREMRCLLYTSDACRRS